MPPADYRFSARPPTFRQLREPAGLSRVKELVGFGAYRNKGAYLVGTGPMPAIGDPAAGLEAGHRCTDADEVMSIIFFTCSYFMVDALEEADELRRHRHIHHEIRTGEGEDDRHVRLVGDQCIDLDARALRGAAAGSPMAIARRAV